MKSQAKATSNLKSTVTIVQIGMLTAVIAVLSQIAFPLPSGVPVTLQTFAVALAAYVLGWKAGTISTLIYVLLGMIGVPVFSGFKGGVSMLFGKTGGFIIGFIFMTLLCGLGFTYQKKLHHTYLIVLSLAGLVVCHLFGIVQFNLLTHMGFAKSALLVSVPYLLKDIVSVTLAYFASLAIRKAINQF